MGQRGAGSVPSQGNANKAMDGGGDKGVDGQFSEKVVALLGGACYLCVCVCVFVCECECVCVCVCDRCFLCVPSVCALIDTCRNVLLCVFECMLVD